MSLQQIYLSYEPITSFKDKLLEIKDPKHLDELFAHPVSFGTAGLRGIMKPGVSGINGFTIGQATLALAHYLKHLHPHKELQVAISYDNRHHSMQFAEIAARVLAHEGIHVKLAHHLRPSPWLSFAVKELKCDAGIMITASHNPKIYNGFKVYLSDGGQIVSPHDKAIMEHIKKIDKFYLSSINDPHIELIEEVIDQKYFHMLKSKLKPEHAENLSIVYSPLCGTGAYIIPEALKLMGFSKLHLVHEEMKIDPEFAQITTPNPETDIAMKRSLDLLIKTSSDIALVSDPDADRIGLACLHHGKVKKFNGNEIACLILDYLIQITNELSSKVVVSSFVTTRLLKKMCEAHHITHVETLTGFKYIGQVIDELESTDSSFRFLLGAEESYGYLFGTHVKDKDAIIISVLLAKAAHFAKNHNQTLYDRLLSIYKQYGMSIECTHTLDFPLDTQPETIKQKLNPLIITPPKELFGQTVKKFINYSNQHVHDFIKNEQTTSLLPKADALGFFTQNYWMIIRPSGTEPKLKIYAGHSSLAKGDLEMQKIADEKHLKDELSAFCQKYIGE